MRMSRAPREKHEMGWSEYSPWARGRFRAPPSGSSETGLKMCLYMSRFIFKSAPIKIFERNFGSGHFYTTASKEKRVAKNGVWGHGIAHCVAYTSWIFTVEMVYESRYM